MENEGSLSLAEAAARFLATLSPAEKQEAPQEVNRFIRWCGAARLMSSLSAHEVASYAEWLAASAAGLAEKKLESVRAFLTYARKEKLTPANLAVHLRLRKATTTRKVSPRRPHRTVSLTAEGYERMQVELASLVKERPRLAEAIRRAAADKDVRENAPLEAAREELGQLEARIRELEATLKSAAILDSEKRDNSKAVLGSVAILYDLVAEEQIRYTLVSPREADPLSGRVSVASPMGKALLNRVPGDVIEVEAPVGKLRYRIESVE